MPTFGGGVSKGSKGVSDQIDVPFLSGAVGGVAGWAVEKGVDWIIEQAGDMYHHPQECQDLLQILKDDRLWKVVQALDQLTDMSQFKEWRADYKKLCEALEDAELLLLHHELAQESWRGKAEDCVMNYENAKELLKFFQELCELAKYMQLVNTLRTLPKPHVPRINRAEAAPELEEYLGPADGMPQYNAEPGVVKPIFQHGDELVPHIDDLLKYNRNIGIVGMGGIGKTTIARAVFERAKGRFKHAVWLTVGGEAISMQHMMSLLESASAKLFPGNAPPFTTADQGLQALNQLLKEKKQSVLLVLDDVWHSPDVSVVATLNFATCPDMRNSDSRLIVTTRDRNTLSYTPGANGPDMRELQIVEPPLLKGQPATQLFHHHAFGASDAPVPAYASSSCSGLIKRCGGVPLALQVLGSALRDCTEADEWRHRLAVEESRRSEAEDIAAEVCASSVEALPPSLKKCFVDFAAFPEDARIQEADLLYLFATHAPVLSPHSLDVARAKLQQLVNRSLVSSRIQAQVGYARRAVYYMHDILRTIAVHASKRPEAGCSFVVNAAPAILDRFSSHEKQTIQEALENRRLKLPLNHMHVCMMNTCEGEAKEWPSMPRLQYLHLKTGWSNLPELPDNAGMWQCLRFLSLHCGVMLTFPDQMLQKHVSHISLSCCYGMEKVPEVIGRCSSLRHLDLTFCQSLTHLPDSIGRCKALTLLILSCCKRLACLPEGIWGCSRLQHVDLHSCESLTRLPEGIGSCSELKNLRISECRKLAQLPVGIQGCTQLETLEAMGCLYLTKLPESMKRCSQLRHLNLSFCGKLIHLPQDISSWGQLQYLSLRRCTSLAHVPEGISRCALLQHFDGSGCHCLTQLAAAITGWRQLKRLNLRGCGSLTQLPDGIHKCSQLQHLDVSYCGNLTQIPAGVGRCTQLTHIGLSNCDSFDQLRGLICACSKLQHFILSKCKSLTQLPDEISTCSQLHDIQLSSCISITQLPTGMSACIQLSRLQLYYCDSLTQLDAIGGCSQLKELGIYMCLSLTELPECIGNCGLLEVLSVCFCDNLTQLPQGISGCSQLFHLELEGCHNLRQLPSGIRSCSQLSYARLEDCTDPTWLPPGALNRGQRYAV